MRKILLFLFMIVFPFTTTFAEEIDLNEDGVMGTKVNMYALRNVVRSYPKFIVNGHDCFLYAINKDNFQNSIQKSYDKRGKITLGVIRSTCLKNTEFGYNITSDHCNVKKFEYKDSYMIMGPDGARKGDICMEFIMDVVQEHNKLLMESKDPDGLMSEQSFKLLVSNVSECGSVELDAYGDIEDCRKACRLHAVRNICILKRAGTGESWNRSGRCQCNAPIESEYIYTPTYEDYVSSKFSN